MVAELRGSELAVTPSLPPMHVINYKEIYERTRANDIEPSRRRTALYSRIRILYGHNVLDQARQNDLKAVKAILEADPKAEIKPVERRIWRTVIGLIHEQGRLPMP